MNASEAAVKQIKDAVAQLIADETGVAVENVKFGVGGYAFSQAYHDQLVKLFTDKFKVSKVAYRVQKSETDRTLVQAVNGNNQPLFRYKVIVGGISFTVAPELVDATSLKLKTTDVAVLKNVSTKDDKSEARANFALAAKGSQGIAADVFNVI
jgi:hypothetical protein